jgi:hypothetical protein
MRPLLALLAVALTGCATLKPQCQIKQVVEVGMCRQSWVLGCPQCAVKYDDSTGGVRCWPVAGATYPVCSR